jgi:mycofactocin precursor
VAPIVEQHPDVRERAKLEPERAELEPDVTGTPRTGARPADEVLDEELLVEEVSIDGMCGVY